MSEKTKQILRLSYHVGIYLLTLALGISLLCSALLIYRNGLAARDAAAETARLEAAAQGLDEQATAIKVSGAVADVRIYSREIVSARLLRLLPLAVVWGVVVLCGLLLRPADLPTRPRKKNPVLYMGEERLAASLPDRAATGSEDVYALAVSQRKKYLAFARRLTLGATVVCALLAVLPLLFLTDASHFPGLDVTAEVLAAVLLSLPFVVAMAAVAVVFTVLRDKNTARLAAADKDLRRAGAQDASPLPAPRTFPKKALLIIRVLLLMVGVALVVVGRLCGGAQDVLIKAIKICTECIGLG